MTEYNDEIDEFAPAKEPDTKPAVMQAEPLQVESELESVKEPEQANAYDSIIASQNEQIQALIAQNKSLTDQITTLITNGAQITQQYQKNPMQTFNAPALSDNDDWSLEALAKDIGKHNRH